MENFESLEQPSLEQPLLEQLPPELFNFEEAKVNIEQLIANWGTEVNEAKLRRDARYVDIDVKDLRSRGVIEADETFIPDRVIDTNIKRDKSDIMTFLNSGYRFGIFDCISNPNIDTKQLELEVTKGLSYKGYYREFDRVVDGSILHGQDYLEVVLDLTKPLHVGFEHIGFDKLFYNKKCADIQDSEMVIRKYEVTPYKLDTFTSFGFDEIQIQIIIKNYEKARRHSETINVYKVLFKYDNCVYVAWYCSESKVSGWLKAPEKLRLGIYDAEGEEVEIDMYPIFVYLYCDDEQESLIDHKGRGYLDLPLQEANTAIITGFVNALTKASQTYASPKTDDGESAEMKQLDIKLVPNGIYAKPLEFWNKPYPNVEVLQGVQFLDTKNAIQAGKTAFATNNRKDSRKTARELSIAQEEQSKITSTSLATFSDFFRDVLAFSWQIIQSQAMLGHVTLLLKETTDPAGKVIFANDVEVISQQFDIRPAGDTDIIEAEQERQKIMQDWPVLGQTPVGPLLLEKYIKLSYPKEADAYIAALRAGDVGKTLVGSLLTVLNSDEVHSALATLPPADQQQMQNIVAQAAQYVTQK